MWPPGARTEVRAASPVGIDDCMARMKQALAAVEAMAMPGQDYLVLGR